MIKSSTTDLPQPSELGRAVQAGQARQLRLLDEAIANAKTRGNADPGYLSVLESRRAALVGTQH